MTLGGWNPPGDEAPSNRWQYDVGGGWSPPGHGTPKKGTQFTFHEGFNPASSPKGFHLLASPPGTAAPVDSINYTPDTKEVHQPGVLAPVDKLNYSVIPPSRMRSASVPSPMPRSGGVGVPSGRGGVGSGADAIAGGPAAEWDRSRMSGPPAMATSMPTAPLNSPASNNSPMQLPMQATTPRGPGARPPYMPSSSTSTDWKGVGVGADDQGLVLGDQGYDPSTEDGSDEDPYADPAAADTGGNPPGIAQPPPDVGGARQGPAPVAGAAGFSGQTFPDSQHMQDWDNGKLKASWTLKPHGDPSIPADWVKDPAPTAKNPATGIQYEPPVSHPDGSVTQKGSNGRVYTVKAAPRASAAAAKDKWKTVQHPDGSVWQVNETTGALVRRSAATKPGSAVTWSDEQQRDDGSKYQVSSTGQIRNTGAATKAPTAAQQTWTREDKPDGSVWEVNNTTGETRIVYGPNAPDSNKPITVGNRVLQYDPATKKYVEIYKAPDNLSLHTDSSGNIIGINPETGQAQTVYEDTAGQDKADLANARARQDLIPHASIQGQDVVTPYGAESTLHDYNPVTGQTSTRHYGQLQIPPEATRAPRERTLPPAQAPGGRKAQEFPATDTTQTDTLTDYPGLAPAGDTGTARDTMHAPGGDSPYPTPPEQPAQPSPFEQSGIPEGSSRGFAPTPPTDEPPPEDPNLVNYGDIGMGSGASTKARALGSNLQSDLGTNIPTYRRKKKKSAKGLFLSRNMGSFIPGSGADLPTPEQGGVSPTPNAPSMGGGPPAPPPMPGGDTPPPGGGMPQPKPGSPGSKLDPKILALIMAILQDAQGGGAPPGLPGQPPDAMSGGAPGQMPPGMPPETPPGAGAGEPGFAPSFSWGWEPKDDASIPRVPWQPPQPAPAPPNPQPDSDPQVQPGRPTMGMGAGAVPPIAPQDAMGMGHKFGQPLNDAEPIHKGTDIQAVKGTPVMAPVDGTVKVVSEPKGLGHRVIIVGPDGKEHSLNHLSTVNVKDGDQVRKGQPIGKVGDSGNTTGAHLDYRQQNPDGSFNNPEPDLGGMADMPPVPGTEMMGTGQGWTPPQTIGAGAGWNVGAGIGGPSPFIEGPQPENAYSRTERGSNVTKDPRGVDPAHPFGSYEESETLPSDADIQQVWGGSKTQVKGMQGWRPPLTGPIRRTDDTQPFVPSYMRGGSPHVPPTYPDTPEPENVVRHDDSQPYRPDRMNRYLPDYVPSEPKIGAGGAGGMGAGGMRLANGKWSDALADTPQNQAVYGQGSGFKGSAGYNATQYGVAAPSGGGNNPGNNTGGGDNKGGGDNVAISPSAMARIQLDTKIAEDNHARDSAQIQQSITNENNRHAEQLQSLQQQAQQEADWKAVQEAVAAENNRHNQATERLQQQQQDLDLKLETMKEQNSILLQQMQQQQQTQMFGRTSRMGILDSALKNPWLASLTGLAPKGAQAGQAGIGGNNIQSLIDQILGGTGGPDLGNQAQGTTPPSGTGAPDWQTWQSWSPFQRAAWRANTEAAGPGSFENAQAGAQQGWTQQGGNPNVTQLAGATADQAGAAGMEMTANMFGDTAPDFWTQQNKQWSQSQAPTVKQNALAGGTFKVGG